MSVFISGATPCYRKTKKCKAFIGGIGSVKTNSVESIYDKIEAIESKMQLGVQRSGEDFLFTKTGLKLREQWDRYMTKARGWGEVQPTDWQKKTKKSWVDLAGKLRILPYYNWRSQLL